jgi:pyruvyltransferase
VNRIYSGLRKRVGRVFAAKKTQTSASQYDWHEPTAYFWQRRPGHYNFGDHLARAVVERVLQLTFSTSSLLVAAPRTVFSIGSVLHLAKTGDTIWGSGRNGKIPDSSHTFTALDVRALRGPSTHRWLATRLPLPETLPYGDPALLVPHIFDLSGPLIQTSESTPAREILIPNLNDIDSVPDRFRHLVVDPTLPWYVVVEKIKRASAVYTSSLHGLVLADAFAKPVALLHANTEPMFKYEDYAAGASRSKSLEISTYGNMSDRLSVAQLAWDPWPLLAAFPFDVYAGAKREQALGVLKRNLALNTNHQL